MRTVKHYTRLLGGCALVVAFFAVIPCISAAPTIMAVGDSITVGFGATNSAGYLSYLASNLGGAYEFLGSQSATTSGGSTYRHEGYEAAYTENFRIGGNFNIATTPTIGQLAQQNPDIMLLHIGTNDINSIHLKNYPIYPYQTAEAVAGNVYTLLDQISQNDDDSIKVYLALIIPFNYENNAGNNLVQKFNSSLLTGLSNFESTHTGIDVELVDMYSLFLNQNYFYDALHPNDDGYLSMAQAWSQAINPVPIPGAAWLFGTGLIGLIGLRRKFQR